MNLYERILALEEHSDAIIHRLADFKRFFADSSLRPSKVKRLMELKAWPLVKENERDPDESKVISSLLFDIFIYILSMQSDKNIDKELYR